MKESNYTDFADPMGETDAAVKARQAESVPTTTAGDPPDDDIYVLLQGPAHIKPLNGTGEGIEVTFLDDAGKPTKDSINFKFDSEKDFSALKIFDLQLIIECDKTKFKGLQQSGTLTNYFPKIYNKIDKTEDNIPSMNPPDPPFNEPK